MANHKLSANPLAADIFNQVVYGLMSVRTGARRLGLSPRQFYRRLSEWKKGGSATPTHGNKGRIPVNRIPDEVRQKILEFAATKYSGFPPTLLTQYLNEHEGIRVSKETVRKLLKAFDPEYSERGTREGSHPLRRRRTRHGELVQIDGSPHNWFGDEARPCTLIAFIDDATSAIGAAGFFPTETAEGYMTVLLQYIKAYGIPLALYSDRHGIFHATRGGSSSETQFQRVCESLGIELILAKSPEAKGRVERLFRTLQQRWPLEFKVLGIKDMATANERMSEFIQDFNNRYGIEPRNPESADCLVAEESMPDVELTCSTWHERTMSKSLTVSFNGQILQVLKAEGRRFELIGKKVYVIESLDRKKQSLCYINAEGKKFLLTYEARERKTLERIECFETSKTVNARVDEVVEKDADKKNRFIEFHNKEAQRAVERKARREERDKKAKELEEKMKARNTTKPN